MRSATSSDISPIGLEEESIVCREGSKTCASGFLYGLDETKRVTWTGLNAR
jgi:hypothetical protein